MKCPHCAQEIDDKDISHYLASKGGKKGGSAGGKKSKRAITPEQQAKMQAGKKNKQEVAT